MRQCCQVLSLLITFAFPAVAAATPILSTSPASLEFGIVSVTDHSDLELTVSNDGTSALTVFWFSISGADPGTFTLVSPPATPFNVGPGASVTLTVRFAPTVAGPSNATLTIGSNDPSDPIDVSLSGHGRGPQINVSPASLGFNDVEFGQVADLVLLVTNSGGGVLSVSDLSIAGADASSFSLVSRPELPFGVDENGMQELTVRFAPGTFGPKYANLVIGSNDINTQNKLVPLSGTGAGPVMTTSPSSLDFGAANVGSVQYLPLTITNDGSGNVSLMVTGLSISGSDPTASFTLVSPPATPFSVSPGSSVTLTVQFAPTAAGPSNATLTIGGNDPGGPVDVVSLTGFGRGPEINVFPASLDYGGVPFGEFEDLELVVTNVGGGVLTVSNLTLSGADATSFSLVSPPDLPFIIGDAGAWILTVRFTAGATGPRSANLVISSSDVNTPNKLVPLNGIGVRPRPVIAGVRDVPNDQGGKVKLSWDASTLDTQPTPVVDHYWLFRSVPPRAAQAAIERGTRARDFGEAPLEESKSVLYQSTSATGTIYWELFATVPALHFIGGYSYIAPTLNDSTGSSNPLTLFMVMAMNAGSSNHWDSDPDSGYSVDNLAPSTPVPFFGAYVGGATRLHWGRNSETDLAGYRIYRGATEDFAHGPGNLVAAPTDTGFADAGAPGSYYKLTAIDSHGNESPFALLTPRATLNVLGREPAALALARPVPNPSSGESEFAFSLPTSGQVTLAIYDHQGRVVRDLARGERPAGEHRVRWDGRDEVGRRVPSGIYFARLNAAGRALHVRVAVVR